MITDANTQRAARRTLANHDTDQRRAQARHDGKILRDGLRDASLFRVDTGVGSGGVDQCNHRHFEALGHFHEPHCLAVPLGLGHTEIAVHLVFDRTTLLLANDHHWPVVESRHTTDNGLVVGKVSITM